MGLGISWIIIIKFSQPQLKRKISNLLFTKQFFPIVLCLLSYSHLPHRINLWIWTVFIQKIHLVHGRSWKIQCCCFCFFYIWQSGNHDMDVTEMWGIYRELISVLCVFPAGTKCRRPAWHWTAPWRTSPWSSTVCNPVLCPSRADYIAQTPWPPLSSHERRGEGSNGGNGAKRGQHSNHLRKMQCPESLPGNWTFFPAFSGNRKNWLFHTSSVQNFLWKMFSCFAPPLLCCSLCWTQNNLLARRTPGHAQTANLMQQSGRLCGDGTPATFGVFLFPKSNPVYINVLLILILFCIDYLLTVL